MKLKALLRQERYGVKADIDQLPAYIKLTERDYAVFAKASYLDGYVRGRSVSSFVGSEGWEKIPGYFEVLDFDDRAGYYGVALIRMSDEAGKTIIEIIFSHRGTDTVKRDMIPGWISLALGGDSGQRRLAKNFTDQVLINLGLFQNSQLIGTANEDYLIRAVHVGHSLGGALAVMMGATYSHDVVAFEAPSVPHLVDRIHQRNQKRINALNAWQNLNFDSIIERIRKKKNTVRIYNVAFSIVSQPRSESVRQRLCFIEDGIVARHRIDRILKRCFDKNGAFIDANVKQMRSERNPFFKNE